MGHVHEPDYFYGDQDESVESFGAFRISRPRLSTTHSYDLQPDTGYVWACILLSG